MIWLLDGIRDALAAGATLFKNVYDEYGRPGAANQGRFQYTGQMWLAEAGLYHYKARLYDPGLGRFLQTDPIGYADGLNLYAYVGGDPVNRRDPSGLEADEVVVYGVCSRRCNDSNSAAYPEIGRDSFGAGGEAGGGGFGGGGGQGTANRNNDSDETQCSQALVDIGNSFREFGDTLADFGAGLTTAGPVLFLINPRTVIGTRGGSLPAGGAVVATGGAAIIIGGYADVVGASLQSAGTRNGNHAFKSTANFAFGLGVSAAANVTGPVGSLLIGGLVDGLSLLGSEPERVQCPTK